MHIVSDVLPDVAVLFFYILFGNNNNDESPVKYLWKALLSISR